MKKNFSRYVVPAVIALIIAAAFFVLKKLYSAESAGLLIGGLSDAFLVPGVMMCGIGLISWAGKLGTFDMLGYGSRLFVGHFSKTFSEKTPKTFYDYKVRKDGKGRTWLKECTAVGAVCIIISLIFTVIFYLL